jgi:hypothetical protein
MMRRAIVIALGALVILPALSDAHLMPEGQGSTRIVGNKAYTLISVPVAVLTGFDDDRNGAISVVEARVHFDTLQAQIERRLKLFNDHNVAGRTIYKDLQVPHWDSSSAVQAKAVIQIRVSQWDAPPKSLRLRADIFTMKDRELYFRAIMGDSTEAATLTHGRREMGFFGAQITPKAPSSLLAPGLTLAALVTIAVALMSARARRVQPAQ